MLNYYPLLEEDIVSKFLDSSSKEILAIIEECKERVRKYQADKANAVSTKQMDDNKMASSYKKKKRTESEDDVYSQDDQVDDEDNEYDDEDSFMADDESAGMDDDKLFATPIKKKTKLDKKRDVEELDALATPAMPGNKNPLDNPMRLFVDVSRG